MIQVTHHFQQHLKHSYHNIQVNNEQDTNRSLLAPYHMPSQSLIAFIWFYIPSNYPVIKKYITIH